MTGISSSSRYRTLRALVSAGLVQKIGETWIRESDGDALRAALDRFALDAGVSTRTARQKATHKVERDARAAWFANAAPAEAVTRLVPGWKAINGHGFWPRGTHITGVPEGEAHIGHLVLAYSHRGEMQHLLASRARGVVAVTDGQVAVLPDDGPQAGRRGPDRAETAATGS
jgi:hypothetical protein